MQWQFTLIYSEGNHFCRGNGRPKKKAGEVWPSIPFLSPAKMVFPLFLSYTLDMSMKIKQNKVIEQKAWKAMPERYE